MSKNLLACAITATESAFVRIKASVPDAYTVTACNILPIGSCDLKGKKQSRTLRKLLDVVSQWRKENLAICFSPDTYLPLDTYFPVNTSKAAYADYCHIEASHFLNRPEEYLHDHLPYAGYAGESGVMDIAKHLLLFYRAEPLRTLMAKFSEHHPLDFCGSPLLPTVHRSKTCRQKTVFLDIGSNHVTLTIAENGELNHFNCHTVRERKEAEYFAIHELYDNPVCRNDEVQTSGLFADKAMKTLLERETSCKIVPLGLPDNVKFPRRRLSACRSPIVSRAISTALMAFDN